MDLVTAGTLLKQSFDLLRQLRDIDKAVDQASLKASLASVMSDLADVRMALADAAEASREKDFEIARIRRDFEVRADLVERYAFKYRRSDKDHDVPEGWPICPRCETVDGRIVFTVSAGFRSGSFCPQCKTKYGGAPFWLDGEMHAA